jgi:hypothetical protein
VILTLVRRDDLAIAVTNVVVYSTGVTGHLVTRLREPDPATHMRPMHPLMFHGRGPGGELPPELLRFGVEFSDGQRATTLGGRPRPDGEPPEAVLIGRGGGGGGGQWELGFWLWPVPPPGSLTFAVEWPLHNVELTKQEIDAGPILEAAARSEQLWPDDRPFGGTAWSQYA